MTDINLEPTDLTDQSLANAPCFIERQFPVTKLSDESYKERTAKQGQTLTGLGKWWGRKPLVLARAVLLGLLMPASDDPEKDRQMFLKLMTMDTEGLWLRKSKPIPGQRLVKELLDLPKTLQKSFFDPEAPANDPRLRKLNNDEKIELQRLVFDRMPYKEKLEYCSRPEQIDGPSPEAWVEINSHLGTNASSLTDLVEELGQRRFGHRPRCGDAFCGGGSLPFELARLGCDVYASDLNPVGGLLTWSGLNIVAGGQETASAVMNAQRRVFEAVDSQVREWGIEQNSHGWRADAYLYCVEVIDPESGWRIPLASSWVIGEKTHTIARLKPDEINRRYDIEIIENMSVEEVEFAREAGTVKDFRLTPPGGNPSTPIESIRRDLRMWESNDLIPRPDDVFQERLYCIRWVETYRDSKGQERTRRHYRAPTLADMQREAQVLELLRQRFENWQNRGYIPSRRVEPGKDINRPTNARGWTYWHHFYTPRQLLITGLFAEMADRLELTPIERVGILLGIGKLADWNCRLSRWNPNAANEKGEQAFYKPSLSTPISNYCCRALQALDTVFLSAINSFDRLGEVSFSLSDARVITSEADIWITDPPYADAVNYHELSEFFLAWYDRQLPRLFPGWYSDSRRALAVVGASQEFRESMLTCYRNLASRMPDNGMQVVMFTHNDASVWADLALILWAAGLRVTAAWTVATETDSTLKHGNYVQGTVLLVLRKVTTNDKVFLDEVQQGIEPEVKRQLDSMRALEDNSEPNFTDTDYQLAAYAAALRVITGRPNYEIDPVKELVRKRTQGQISRVEELIRYAVRIAADHMVPRGMDRDVWRQLSPLERFYFKGLEMESHGEYRSGVYQELARGYGAGDYGDLLASGRANETRLKSAGEFGRRMLSGSGFAGSLTRQCLFAISLVMREDDTHLGRTYLRTELDDEYWNQRRKIIHILEYLAGLRSVSTMPHWRQEARVAELLAGALNNDHA